MSIITQNKIDKINQDLKDKRKRKRELEKENQKIKKAIEDKKAKQIGEKVQESILKQTFETTYEMEKFIRNLKREIEKDFSKGGYEMKINKNNKSIERIEQQINRLIEERNEERNKLSKEIRKNRSTALHTLGGMMVNIFKIDVLSIIETEVDGYFKENGENPSRAERNKRIKKVFGDLAREKIEELLKYKNFNQTKF